MNTTVATRNQLHTVIMKKRKNMNRYDKFSRNFYDKVQKSFIKIARKDPKRCLILNNSADSNVIEKIIINKVIKKLKK